jgi:hypothetical protein
MNGYELSRNWFDWCFENTEKISPNHSALYFFIIEQCNRLGWKEKFGLPTSMTKEAVGIRSYNTYVKTLNDLVEWGFIVMIEKSKNQYTSNIVALSNNDKALDKALDKAIAKASVKHVTKQSESTGESISSIDKPLTKEPLTIEPLTIEQTEKAKLKSLSLENDFKKFWDLYDYNNGLSKCKVKFFSIKQEDIDIILKVVSDYVTSTPDKQYRKHPLTWLKGRCWEDEIKQPLNFKSNTPSPTRRRVIS